MKCSRFKAPKGGKILRHNLKDLWTLKRAIFIWAVSFFLLIPLNSHGQGTPEVSSIRLGERSGDVMRLVLDVDQAIKPAVSVLADPYRLVIDLPALSWPSQDGVGQGRGFVGGYRYGLFSPTQSRLVLDLKKPATVSNAFLLQPSGRFLSLIHI